MNAMPLPALPVPTSSTASGGGGSTRVRTSAEALCSSAYQRGRRVGIHDQPSGCDRGIDVVVRHRRPRGLRALELARR